jgi:indolepyruvate ferredoxin oxidoreductase alpha subunit
MKKQLLLGAEAIALAAIDAGISGVYAYPGTPSTEITEFIQRSSVAKQNGVHSKWAVNEKTAYEAALGMSYAGKRSLVCMKHVGLNVAADPFMCSAITGVHGGLVVVVADDPSMHSSQNEQDTRAYGRFAYVPVIEPSNQQEAYDAVRYAFDLSEQVKLPILLRITTRLSHSRAGVKQQAARAQNTLNPSTDKKKWILIPSNARPNYAKLLDLQPQLAEISEASTLNQIVEGTGSKAVIAFGIAYNYIMEIKQAEKLDIPVLKISHYPLPDKKIREFTEKYDDILIAEEGYPIYEELLKGYFGNTKFRGRLDGALPRMGELSPDALAKAFGVQHKQIKIIPKVVASRPPMLCQGCGHIDLYDAMNRIFESSPEKHVFSDIGCYALGALEPYDAISTCVDMGASITMAKGAADAGYHPAVAVIGDSTFTHSGITGLLDAVNDEVAITVIISDNSTIAMTGGQDSSASDKIYDICKGVGVDEAHIRFIEPLRKNLQNNIAVIQEEFDYKGVSVIIAQRECVQMAGEIKKTSKKKSTDKTASVK